LTFATMKKAHRLHRFTQIIKKIKKNLRNLCNLWASFFHRFRVRPRHHECPASFLYRVVVILDKILLSPFPFYILTFRKHKSAFHTTLINFLRVLCGLPAALESKPEDQAGMSSKETCPGTSGKDTVVITS
jgi:hypothetical protein